MKKHQIDRFDSLISQADVEKDQLIGSQINDTDYETGKKILKLKNSIDDLLDEKKELL